MTDKEPVKLTTTNTLQSEENTSRKNCNLQNFVPPDGGSRVRYFSTYFVYRLIILRKSLLFTVCYTFFCMKIFSGIDILCPVFE